MSPATHVPTGAASQARFEAELVAWLNGRFARDGVVIGATTPLFTTRLVDSLRILELIAFTERALEIRIPDDAVRMDNFATPGRIAEVFAARAGGHDADA